MKLHGTIAVHVAGADILRRPGLFDRMRRAFGGEPDLRTGRVRASLEASAVVDGVRAALADLGATNAVSLVLDDVVLFQDRDRRDDDLGDLFLAFHEHSPAIGGAGFGLLRLAVEHVEAGLHVVLEVQARTEHPVDEHAVRVVISARVKAFEPRPGEDAEAYRARVEPLTRDATTIELARVSFDSFVHRVREAIARAMPEARAEVVTAQAQVVAGGRAGERGHGRGRARERDGDRRQRPTDPQYDPHEAAYPNPMLGLLGGLMLTSMMGSMVGMMMSPGILVVDEGGAVLGDAADGALAAADPGGVDGAGVGDAEAGDPGLAEAGDLGGFDADLGGFDVGDPW